MERVGPTLALIAVSVSAAIATIVIVLALFASRTMWIVLPVSGILGVLGCVLGIVAWKAGVGAD